MRYAVKRWCAVLYWMYSCCNRAVVSTARGVLGSTIRGLNGTNRPRSVDCRVHRGHPPNIAISTKVIPATMLLTLARDFSSRSRGSRQRRIPDIYLLDVQQ